MPPKHVKFNFLKGTNLSPKRQARMAIPKNFNDLKQIVRNVGLLIQEARGKGGHYGVVTPEGNIITVIPFHGGQSQIPIGTMNSILKAISEYHESRRKRA